MNDERMGKISYWGIACGPHQRRMAELRVKLSRLIVNMALKDPDSELTGLPISVKAAVIAAEQVNIGEWSTEIEEVNSVDGPELRTYRWLLGVASSQEDVELMNVLSSRHIPGLMAGRKH